MHNIYKIITYIFLILSPLVVIFRIFQNKEHPKRFVEKFGYQSQERVKGKLVWIHGSSVGEILSVIPLIENFEKKNNIKQIILTSSTLSSSKVLKKFKLKKTIHQFFPIDNNIIISKFLNYWKPSIAMFVESEIWPNMIFSLKKRNIPLVLLNARITKKTFKKWSKFSFYSKSIFNKFDICLSQNKETSIYLKKLGAKKIKYFGNLKFSATNIKPDIKLNINTKKFLKIKKILFAVVSSHQGEEIFCANVFKILKNKFKKSILLLIPRHIERAPEIMQQLSAMGFKVHLHSTNKKISKQTDIYLVDTFGETKLFLKYSRIVFMGGSIVQHGGQNPLEAARFGCKILHGKNIENFKEVYDLLNKINISYKINNKKGAISKIREMTKRKYTSKNNINKINYLGKQILLDNEKELIKYF